MLAKGRGIDTDTILAMPASGMPNPAMTSTCRRFAELGM